MKPVQVVIDSYRQQVDMIYGAREAGEKLSSWVYYKLAGCLYNLRTLDRMALHRFKDAAGDHPGHAFVIESFTHCWPTWDHTTRDWLEEYVQAANYALYEDVLGIVFRYAEDAVAFRLRS